MIEFRNVTKVYKNGVRALNNVSVSIDSGEFIYLIGSTGAGKSTFIKLLYCEELATSGKVLVAERDVTKIKRSKVPYFRRRLGVVFQDYKLLPKKTVFENIAFALEVTNTPKEQIRKKVKKSLDLVGLADKARFFPHQLSGGQQQRVAIARAIVNNPRVLIADEPTGNLDPDTSKEIMQVLERINQKFKTTIVMVTHDKQIVDEYKKRTIIIEDGFISSDSMQGGYDNVYIGND